MDRNAIEWGAWQAPDGLIIPYCNLKDLPLDDQFLLGAARWARRDAYAPHSHFLVGVAMLTMGGNIREGHNMENVIFDVLHGEGCALGGLKLQDGARVTRIAVVAAKDENVVQLSPASAPVTCCGKCRQMIWEFCGGDTNVEILMSDPLLSRVWVTSIGKMLPAAFGPEVLNMDPQAYMQERQERLRVTCPQQLF